MRLLIFNLAGRVLLFGPVIKPSYLWELGYHKLQSSPKLVQTCQFVSTIEYNQPTQNNFIIVIIVASFMLDSQLMLGGSLHFLFINVGIYRLFSIRSRATLGLVIPNK